MSLRDELSGRHFLVDSGADVSVFPKSMISPLAPSTAPSGTLVAANGSAIDTYGSRRLSLRFNKLNAVHPFLLADVPRPILGSDFFSARDLLIDVRNRQLVRLPRISSPSPSSQRLRMRLL